MKRVNYRYILSLIYHGSKYASDSIKAGDNRKKYTIVGDMLSLYFKYRITASEYLEFNLGAQSKEERPRVLRRLRAKYHWTDVYDENWQFLVKYSGFEWQKKKKIRRERKEAYIKHYNMGPHCKVQYGVTFIAEHHNVGDLKIGDYCLFARNCDIDITGDLEIGNHVGILEGAKILTHAHDSYHFKKESDLIPYSNRAFKTNLKIGDNVSVCAHAVILPGVTEIGEGSVIQAGAIVSKPVPPHVIVGGNPATIMRKIPTVAHRKKES